MSKPIVLPDAQTLLAVCQATWPPVSSQHLGAWTIRDGGGGGSRVSAATEDWPVTDADLPAAERAMAKLDQTPLFMIRDGEDKLDALLEAHGYDVRDPVNIWAIPVRELIGNTSPASNVYVMWPPLELMRDLWKSGGIGAARQAVMERSDAPKTGILVRVGDYPGGVAFVGISDNVAMVHALHVDPAQRRKGAATMMLRAAARWAADQGADVLSLLVTQGNHAANPLYAALGMRLVGHYHYRVKSGAG